jgi:hypothetical protein
MNHFLSEAGSIVGALKLRTGVSADTASALLAQWIREQSVTEAEHRQELRPKEIKSAIGKVESVLKKALMEIESQNYDVRYQLAKILDQPTPEQLGAIKDSSGTFRYPEAGMQRFRALENEIGTMIAAAQVARKNIKPKSGRPKDAVRATSITILSDIYEWISGVKPTRRVHGGNAPLDTYGKDYGPFWDFCLAVWGALYGNSKGLSNQMQKWEKYSKKCETFSRWVTVQLESHPEWGKSS